MRIGEFVCNEPSCRDWNFVLSFALHFVLNPLLGCKKMNEWKSGERERKLARLSCVRRLCNVIHLSTILCGYVFLQHDVDSELAEVWEHFSSAHHHETLASLNIQIILSFSVHPHDFPLTSSVCLTIHTFSSTGAIILICFTSLFDVCTHPRAMQRGEQERSRCQEHPYC